MEFNVEYRKCFSLLGRIRELNPSCLPISCRYVSVVSVTTGHCMTNVRTYGLSSNCFEDVDAVFMRKSRCIIFYAIIQPCRVNYLASSIFVIWNACKIFRCWASWDFSEVRVDFVDMMQHHISSYEYFPRMGVEYHKESNRPLSRLDYCEWPF